MSQVVEVLRRWGPRAVGLLVTAVGIYVVAPSVVALLGEWPQLRDVKGEWFAILLALEVGAWVCQAVIATLLYRLVSFWFPIPLGAIVWTGWRLTDGRAAVP